MDRFIPSSLPTSLPCTIGFRTGSASKGQVSCPARVQAVTEHAAEVNRYLSEWKNTDGYGPHCGSGLKIAGRGLPIWWIATFTRKPMASDLFKWN